ncbi:hypothetical protein GCM10010271_65180 [Streptomyces kurssanovii]|nr:hypothetical protein GCM10010271_65180 [Streptomyces kurssanovii]
MAQDRHEPGGHGRYAADRENATLVHEHGQPQGRIAGQAAAQPYLDAEDSLRAAARLAADLFQPIRAALADFVTGSGHGVQRTLLAAYGPLLTEMNARQPTTRDDTNARAWRIAMDDTVVALTQLPGQDGNTAYEAGERAVRHSLTALARPLLRRVEELHTTFGV